MWVTTARFAHCLRCTNCSRQFCTEDFSQCLTRNKQKIRLASENPTRQKTTLQRTDWLSRNATSGESKCGQRQLTSRRRSIPSLKSIWDALKSCNIDHDGICTDGRREQHFQDPKRNQARWSAVQLAVQHGSSILTEGRNSTMAKEQRNGYKPERPRSWLPHKPEICRRRDAVRNIQRTDTDVVVLIQESYWKSGTQDPSR